MPVLEPSRKTRHQGARAATILVVEDDRAIRYLFTEVLRGAGHTVIACEDGTQALEAVQAHMDEIDAVVTDSHMPGISGREMIAQIRALRPGIPILVVSGGYDEPPARTPEDTKIVYLCKPLSPDQLTISLRRLLYGRM